MIPGPMQRLRAALYQLVQVFVPVVFAIHRFKQRSIRREGFLVTQFVITEGHSHIEEIVVRESLGYFERFFTLFHCILIPAQFIIVVGQIAARFRLFQLVSGIPAKRLQRNQQRFLKGFQPEVTFGYLQI
jgi:hypothetical protein